MMQSTIRTTIDSEMKKQAVEILKAQGWSMSDFLRHSIQLVVQEHQIPFEKIPHLNKAEKQLFATIEQSAKTMTKQDLMKAMGL